MRIAALVFGILGGLAALALGITWLSDVSEAKELISAVNSIGGDTSALDKLTWAAYLLLAGSIAGIAGGVLAMKGKRKPAAAILLAAALLPAVLAPKSLVFTFLLILAGIFAFVSKPKISTTPANRLHPAM